MVRVENVARELPIGPLILEETLDIGFRNFWVTTKEPEELQPIIRGGLQPEPGILVGNRKNGIGKRGKPLDL
jgi:hypothetical protein